MTAYGFVFPRGPWSARKRARISSRSAFRFRQPAPPCQSRPGFRLNGASASRGQTSCYAPIAAPRSDFLVDPKTLSSSMPRVSVV